MRRLLVLAGLAGVCSSVVAQARASDSICESNSVAAGAIRTTRNVEAFVNCAYEYVRQHGIDEARRAFHEDARWRHGLYYVFVDGVAETAQGSTILVYPPEPSLEGSTWGQAIGDLVDGFGTNVLAHDKQVLDLAGRGWTYAKFRNPSTGIEEPKASYVIRLDWNGTDAFIGAGIYLRDRPGTCRPEHVNAAALEANPTDELLQEFVRCAALKIESMGYFAAPILSRDPRWLSGQVYVFGVNTFSEEIEFSGRASSFEASRRVREIFDGRDAVGVGATFGEAFWYHDFTDPATGQLTRKVSFVKRVMVQGIPLLVGSGYYRSGIPQ